MDCVGEEKGSEGGLSVKGGDICYCCEELGERAQGEEPEERGMGGQEGVGGMDIVVVC